MRYAFGSNTPRLTGYQTEAVFANEPSGLKGIMKSEPEITSLPLNQSRTWRLPKRMRR
jgi:hypothetical protein